MERCSKVVVMIFDGLRPDMVTAERMPHLHAFAKDSLWYREARSVFPSMTRVATSSIATGAPPALHGIVGNAFYYPQVTTSHILDVSLPDDIALAERALGHCLIGPETFADCLAAHGKSLSVVHAGSGGSVYAINPRVVANNHWTFSVLGEAFSRTPHAVAEMVERIGPLPVRTLPRFEETDYVTRVFIEHVLAERQDDVSLIWFNEPDTSFHYRFLGSDDTRAMMKAVDESFRKILTAIQSRHDAEEIAIIIGSDHGQISSSGISNIGQMLTQNGHIAGNTAQRPLDGAEITITGGNMGEIRIVNGDMDRRDTIARWLMQRDEIGMVFTPSDDPVRGSVEGTFSLKLVGMDHHRSPELVYVMRSGIEDDPYGLPGLGLVTGGVPLGGGMHGGLNRHELNTVLILGGAAAPNQATINTQPCGIVDIGPTILGLLGLRAPTSMVGIDLSHPANMQSTVPLETYDMRYGTFHQQLTIARRAGHLFPIHGERLAM